MALQKSLDANNDYRITRDEFINSVSYVPDEEEEEEEGDDQAQAQAQAKVSQAKQGNAAATSQAQTQSNKNVSDKSQIKQPSYSTKK